MRYKPKTRPFKHQSRATIAAVRHRNYAVFFEPRLGKTKVALDYVAILALKGEVKRVLVLFPAIARDVWESEIEKHYPYFYEAEDFDSEWQSTTTIFAGDPPEVKFFLASREETMVKRGGERPKQEIVEAWNPDAVVIDESHEYKRPGGRGAQDAWRMIRRLRKRRAPTGLPYVVLLSGTPNPKGWRDLFAQFRIMDDTIFGTNAGEFDERYVRRHKVQQWRILGYKNERRLVKKIRAHSIAVNAEDAGLANEQFFQSIYIDLPPKVRKLYLDLAKDFIAEWEGGTVSAKNAGVKRLRLLQICGGFSTAGDVYHREKVAGLRAYAHQLLEQGESVLVYSRFLPEVDAAYGVLQDLGFSSFRVAGSTSTRDRRHALTTLGTRPKEPSAIAFQYQAGSRAIELVGAAEVVYYGLTDGWVDYFQSMKRIQGPNQHRPCRYTHLICRGTAEVSALKGLQNKEDQHALLMKNPRRYLLGL